MSVENHRHCQATVLAATGIPFGQGRTWNTISELELPNLPNGWVDTYFKYNANVTDDLAGILKLINWLAGRIQPSSPLPGDIINIGNDNRTVNVRNNISTEYSSVVGITSGNQQTRMLKACPIWVENTDPDGEIIAYLVVGDERIPIRANIQQSSETEPRYVITEDRVYDIVLSGGENDGCPLDYNEI